MPKAYSFLDTQATIVGPGGNINIGSSAGVAEEGITFSPAADANSMTIGADGIGFNTLNADKSGTITIRILKVSPTNALLSAMMAVQRASSANWGQNTITCVNTSQGDVVTCQQVAFKKAPELGYGKVGAMNEWTFDCITMDIGLGGGL